MDLATTSLTAAEWLNQQFRLPEALDNPEAFTGKLLMNLQHEMYKAQQAMDDTSGHVIDLRSSFAHDIPSIRAHSNYLIHDLTDLHSRVESKSGLANTSLQKIRATELVKQRMEQTYRSLENQDNWDALLSNIKELIANNDLDAIGGRLSSLQKCFLSLSDSVDHDQRQTQMESVKNSVESFLTPRLIAGLSATVPWKSSANSRNVTSSEGLILKIVGIFDLMRRTETLKRILSEFRQKQFIARWTELLKSSQDDSTEMGIDECLGNFYEDLSSFWHNQLPLYTAAYPDPANALMLSYVSIISDLQPNFTTELQAARQKSLHSAGSALDFLSALLAARQAQESFCAAVEKDYNHFPTRNAELSQKLVAAVRKPLNAVLTHYVELEMVAISGEFSRCFPTTADKGKTLHTLLASATRLSSAFYSAIVRCFQLTDGLSLIPLVTRIDAEVAEYAKKVREFARDLKTPVTEAPDKKSDFTESDADTLNNLVKVLQICGDLVLQLENIDDMLKQGGAVLDLSMRRLFSSSITTMEELANAVFQWSLSLLLRPVEVFLEGAPSLSTWTSSATRSGVPDIPSFGFDPQEYITRIGNYLLTLPQIMDPVLFSESPSMRRLKTMLVFQGLNGPPDDSTSLTEAWIQATVYESMLIVTTAWTKTRHLTSVGIRQLIADSRYFQNVVEDFAVPLSDTCSALIDLLSCSYEDFLVKQDSSPPIIVNFIKRARNFD